MHSGQEHSQAEKASAKWNSLPPEEKKRQFRELVRSPYWHFLPEEIKDQLQKKISSKDGK